MLRNLLILCALCLLAIPAFATEADFEKQMARGVAALDAGNALLAQEEFRAALKEHPGDPEATLYLAIALNRTGDPATESELKAALRLEPGNPRTNYELGTYYYKNKLYEESGDYFENLLTLNPDAEMKTAAERYLATIRGQSGGKRWSVSMVGGMQYDSNVPMAANGVQLPVGIDRKGDWRGIFNLALGAVPFRDSDSEIALSYGFYQTLQLNLDDFNITQNTFDITIKERILPNLTGKLGLAFELMYLGGKQFDHAYSITPGVILNLTEKSETTLEYRFRESYYKNSALFPTNYDREGVTHSVILGHQVRLSDMFRLRLGYAFDKDVTPVTSWSSDTHSGKAGLSIIMPYSLLLDLSGEASWRKYEAIQTGATAIRDDTTLMGAASLTWQFSSWCSAAAGYHHTSATSNISAYEYTRGITSILLQGRF